MIKFIGMALFGWLILILDFVIEGIILGRGPGIVAGAAFIAIVCAFSGATISMLFEP